MKRLVGDTAIYGISSILGRLLNWLLVPLYVVYFKPSEYAIVVELFAFIALFNIIYTLGFETTYFRFSSQQKQTDQNYFDSFLTRLSSSQNYLTTFNDIANLTDDEKQAVGIIGQTLNRYHQHILLAKMSKNAWICFSKLKLILKLKSGFKEY